MSLRPYMLGLPEHMPEPGHFWLQASLGFIVQEQKLPGPFPHVSGGSYNTVDPSCHLLFV